ncbi:MAG: GNAT family N-acetyltransferase [Planctomycetaceae bacterium]|jgi:hypothetical protein|nr:GNAT family N-acetyltransferase [Planctomycetaceae bacterium]
MLLKMIKSNIGDKIYSRLPDFFEVLILFFVFCVLGGTPIPDVNEPYYIGKAIHFWNPDWVLDDTFLESRDSHLTFYFLFGWFSFFLSPYWMAVTGRFLTWFLLALAWRRLCFTILRVRWVSVPCGLAMAYYVSGFNMAGEWIIGGVEGKSFAFPFVLFGIAELVRGRWDRVWIFLGIASAFHVLVGGWSVIAVIIVHILCRKRPNYHYMIIGGLAALPGMIPGLLLDYGTVGDIVQESHRIYVFERLSHHLVPYKFMWTRILRFLLLTILWITCCRFMPHGSGRQRRFDFFVWGTIIISLIGFILAYTVQSSESISATVLRFYWFRMSDVAVPMGVAIGAMFRLLRLTNLLRHNAFRLPTVCELIIAVTVSVMIFLIADYLLFGGMMFSWTVESDIAVAWCISVLICRLILYLINECKIEKRILSFIDSSNLVVRIGRITQRDGEHSGFSIGKIAKGEEYASISNLKIWKGVIYVVILIYAPFVVFMDLADSRTRFSFPKSESKVPMQAYKWREVCNWIADESNTSRLSKFFIPYDSVTFKWYANRSNVAVWKEVPQDAKSLIQWAESIEELYGISKRMSNSESHNGRNGKNSELILNKISKKPFAQMLSQKTPEEMRVLQEKYKFNYILAPLLPDISKRFGYKIVYKNSEYCVYKVENK